MKDIKVFGFLNDKNYGDKIILDSTEYLFLNKNSDINIKSLDLFYERKSNSINRFLTRVFSKLKKHNIFNNFVVSILWRFSPNGYYKLQRYLSQNINKNSLVVFAGGGIIKYNVQDFSKEVYQIVKYCNNRRIPVFFNSVGVEGYDQNNLASRKFKKALNLPCVKLLSTRDAIDVLEKYRHDFPCRQVCDPAVWIDKAYCVEKKDSSTVGIGLVRENIFLDYGVKVQPEQLLDFYCNLVVLLRKNNIDFEFFINGLDSDMAIIEKINAKMNKNFIVRAPSDEKNLVEIISTYCFTITSRLHAAVISYALEIPNISLVWNDKIKYFCNLVNSEMYSYVENKNIDANIVFDIYMSIKEGIVKKDIEFTHSILKNIEFILSFAKENK